MSVKKELAEYDTEPTVARGNTRTLRAATAAHLAGFGWDVIAERYGYSNPKGAQVAVEAFIGKTIGSGDLQAARYKSLARKERLLQSVWFDATHPFELDEFGEKTENRNEAHLASLDRATRILESIDRLQGLNAPTQVEIYRPGADEFLETIAELKKKVLEGTPQEGDIFDAEVVDDESEVETDAETSEAVA